MKISYQEVNMAVHLSTIKRARQNRKRRLRNRMMKSMVRSAEKKVLQTQNQDEAEAQLRQASSILDKAASKGVWHRRRVARHKSRLARVVNERRGAPEKAEK
jgi:small subunit ribosomal protein S20